MLSVSKVVKNGELHVSLSGTLVETDDLAAVIGSPGTSIVVELKNLSRINSVGVKNWITYFRAAQKSGTKIRYVEVPPAIVEQMNVFRDSFLAGGVVESLYVPYFCGGCHKEVSVLHRTEQLKASGWMLVAPKCPGCGKPTIFDDLAQNYFSCLGAS